MNPRQSRVTRPRRWTPRHAGPAGRSSGRTSRRRPRSPLPGTCGVNEEGHGSGRAARAAASSTLTQTGRAREHRGMARTTLRVACCEPVATDRRTRRAGVARRRGSPGLGRVRLAAAPTEPGELARQEANAALELGDRVLRHGAALSHDLVHPLLDLAVVPSRGVMQDADEALALAAKPLTARRPSPISTTWSGDSRTASAGS
jgi:hypothetical protein